jgi:arylsulfatase A-like enzyme
MRRCPVVSPDANEIGPSRSRIQPGQLSVGPVGVDQLVEDVVLPVAGDAQVRGSNAVLDEAVALEDSARFGVVSERLTLYAMKPLLAERKANDGGNRCGAYTATRVSLADPVADAGRLESPADDAVMAALRTLGKARIVVGLQYRRRMTAANPNVLLIMTDQERYPTPYEDGAVAEFRRTQLPARARLLAEGVQFHRHYVGSTACAPSRATLFTGHYPSLHGVKSTDGLAKYATDVQMQWLDPDVVPTMGHWFQAAGYRTYYKGKWHISHANITAPGSHEGLKASDAKGRVLQDMVELYAKTDRLEPFGFTGWIGREPHGVDLADSGSVRDTIFADQVTDLFDELGRDDDPRPWLAVASFLNPHDIIFAGPAWEMLGLAPPDDTVPDIPEAPSQSDGFDGRPGCQQGWVETWPKMAFDIPNDNAYRRLYYWLHKQVDAAIGAVLAALDTSGLAENTIVVFTSDHGDLLGAHGGMKQKWYNAYDEAIHVPFVIRGPGLTPGGAGIHVPTSHVDLVPTLLGLVGADPADLLAVVDAHHTEAQALPGRDLAGIVRDPSGQDIVDAPIYFMTEDQVSVGDHLTNPITGAPYTSVSGPANIETVVTHLPTGAAGARELWKLNHYYGAVADPDPEATFTEVHNLTVDPEERTNRAHDPSAPVDELYALLGTERSHKRLTPRHINPPAPDDAAALASH